MSTNIIPVPRQNENHASASSTNTAMSLWHKFSMWQSDMDRCRLTIQNIRQEHDQYRVQIEELVRTRKEEQRKVQEIEHPNISPNVSLLAKSLEQLREVQRKLDDAQEKYREATISFQNTKQKYETQKYIRNESIHEAMEQSRTFHQLCQQLQYQLRTTAIAANITLPSSKTSNAIKYIGNDNDLVETSSKAHALRAALYAAVAGTDCNKKILGSEDTWISKTIQDLQDSNFFDSTDVVDNGETNENDPSTWKLCQDKDLELYNAVEGYNQLRENYTMTLKEMQQIQSNYDMLHKKVQDRNQRKEQLQAQLRRIQSDCTTIESEIEQCKQLTLEDEALAHTYRSSTLILPHIIPCSYLGPDLNCRLLFFGLHYRN
jgi:chromosome segregation ATPase